MVEVPYIICTLSSWPKWKNLKEFFGHFHISEVELKSQKERSEHAIVLVGEVIFNVQAGCVPVERVHIVRNLGAPGARAGPPEATLKVN